MALDVISLALSKKHTEDTADGLGAVRGKPCTIKSITPSADGSYNTVRFEWTGNSGATQTQDMRVKNGISVTGASIDSSNLMSLTLSDNTIIPVGTITTVQGDKGDQGDQGEAATIILERTTSGLKITSEDINGTQTSYVYDGFSPTVKAERIEGGVLITSVDKTGTTTAIVRDGADGDGIAADIVIDGVDTLDADEAATVTNVGTMQHAELRFGIPRGTKGDPLTWEDLTDEQKASLKGEAFTYDDLTEEQKEELKGDKGDAFTYEDFTAEQLEGLKGTDGKSAYQVAVDEGFVGDESAWLETLVGEQGVTGKSAYDIYVENGGDLSETDWLDSLIGADGVNGKSAYEVYQEAGGELTLDEWLASLKGDSAYTVAVQNGFVGSQADWISSLKGLSAYQVAVQNGYEGTEEEWLASLSPTIEVSVNTENAYKLLIKNVDGTETLTPNLRGGGTGGTGGVSDYTELENLPTINGHVVMGELTSDDLELLSDLETVTHDELLAMWETPIDNSYSSNDAWMTADDLVGMWGD